MAATKADFTHCCREWVTAQDNRYCYGGLKCREIKGAFNQNTE